MKTTTRFAKQTTSTLKATELSCGVDSKGRARTLKIELRVAQYSEPVTGAAMCYTVAAEEGADHAVTYGICYTPNRNGKPFGPGSAARFDSLADALKAYAKVAKNGTATYRPE